MMNSKKLRNMVGKKKEVPSHPLFFYLSLNELELEIERDLGS